jgi:capsular exopolysaccharide synthesis family protein
MDPREGWFILRRHLPVVVATTLAVGALASWSARQRPPVFEATAAIAFDPSPGPVSYPGGAIQTQARAIESPAVLEAAAHRLGWLPPSPPADLVREVADAVAARVKVVGVAGAHVIEITAAAPSAPEARDLANAVAEVYRAHVAAARSLRLRQIRAAIEQQIREAEARAGQAEEQASARLAATAPAAPLLTLIRRDLEHVRRQQAALELVQASGTRPRGAARVFVDGASTALQELQAAEAELVLERRQAGREAPHETARLALLDERLVEIHAAVKREAGVQIAGLRSRERLLEEQAAALGEAKAGGAEVDRLRREVRAGDDLLAALRARHLEVVLAESGGSEEVRVLDPAVEPRDPIGGRAIAIAAVLLGGLLGLGLGAALAYVREARWGSIAAPEDVVADLGIPVVGLVPHVKGFDRAADRPPARFVTHLDGRSPLAEAYRALRTGVQFLRTERGGKVLLLAGASGGEGTTTAAVNLALTMAQNGQRTLLVDGNLKSPGVHACLGLDREPGLTDVLLDQARWRDCVRTMTDVLTGRFEPADIMVLPGLDNLDVVACGPLPANGTDLLARPSMARLLREVRDTYDVVLVDAPPLLSFAGAAAAAAHADGVLLVHRAGTRGRLGVRRARARLERAGAQVWGVILTHVRADAAAGRAPVQDPMPGTRSAPAWARVGEVREARGH